MKFKFAGYVALRGVLPIAFVVGNSVAVEHAWAIRYLSIDQARNLAFGTDVVAEDLEQNELSKETRAWKILKEGSVRGLFFFDQVIGKHFYIDYSVALDVQGNVIRVDILEYRETHGMEVTNADWLEQFKGVAAHSLLKVGQDIKNISGATLSCKHITEGVSRIARLAPTILARVLK